MAGILRQIALMFKGIFVSLLTTMFGVYVFVIVIFYCQNSCSRHDSQYWHSYVADGMDVVEVVGVMSGCCVIRSLTLVRT